MSSSTWTDLVGLDPGALVDQIVTKGVSKYDAAKLINNLIAVNLGQSPRRFVFSQPLPTSDPPNTAPAFTRTFSHQDWIDGESIVQAGESADDKGFNWRFNALATDLDALHEDIANLYGYLTTLRAALVQALRDVAAELNRLDADAAGVRSKLPPDTPWKVDFADAPQFLGVRELDGSKVTMWKTGTNVMVLPGVDTVALRDTLSQRLGTGGLIVRLAGANEAFSHDLAAGLPVKDLITKYGGESLGDGRIVSQALALLPPDATYHDAKDVADAVNSQEQTIIRSTVGSIEAVGALTGVTSEGTPLRAVASAAILQNIAGAPAGLEAGLSAVGLATVGDISSVPADQLVSRLGQHGVIITQVQAQELASRASMLAGLGLTQ